MEASFLGHNRNLSAIARVYPQAVFTPAGDRIISCGNDNRIQVWDTFSLENLVSMSGHEGSVLCCAVNELATRVVSGGEDCSVRLWSLEDGKQLLAFQVGYSMGGCFTLQASY